MRQRDEDLALELGRRIRRLRRIAGMSQEELAVAAELNRGAISLLERGRRLMGTGTLLRILMALEARPEDLLGGIAWIPAPPRASGTWRIDRPPVQRAAR